MPVEIIDLSLSITEDLPVRFWGHKVLKDFGFTDTTEFRHVVNEKPTYVRNSYLTLFNHGGSHIDGQNHLEQGAKGVDGFPLDKFVGPLRLLDFRSRPKDSLLSRADLEAQGIRPGDVVIAMVGYTPPTGVDDIPSFTSLSAEAAEYLASVPVRAFGTDALSVENFRRLYGLSADVTGYARVAPVHYAFLSRGIPVIEGLVNLEQVVGKKPVVFVGFPLKIADGDASPVRATAFVYQ
jgi:arylformamidase